LAKHCEATKVNFTYLPWLSYIICICRHSLCILFVGIPRQDFTQTFT
jgi:hypothetical protein